MNMPDSSTLEYVNSYTCIETDSNTTTLNKNYPCVHDASYVVNAPDSYKSILRFFAEQSQISNTSQINDINLSDCALHSILRPYQEETVRWMITRETKTQQLRLGKWCIDLPAGGILADEMGLGKTVEVLACILSNQKSKNEINVEDNTNNQRSYFESSLNNGKKRSAFDVPKNCFLHKKPRLSNIKQNALLKYEIKTLLDNYYSEFQIKVLKKLENNLNEKILNHIEMCFKVLLLNDYYNLVKISEAKLQTWAYLVSEYDVHEFNTLGHLILLKDSQKSGEILPDNSALPNEIATSILKIVRDYLTLKIMKKFEKDFHFKMRFNKNIFGNELIPLLEDESVKCSCGSDKAKGAKIHCSKCKSLQHLQCVGLSEEVEISQYCCPSCWMNEPPVVSGATLIIVPTTLVQQWFDEIKKHAANCNLKVYWYKGVKDTYILPPILSSYDIVLVTFNALGGDLSFTNNRIPNLRHVKRYQSFITPLTCIKWWRLCIDEAQMVENINRVSEMAALLKVEHLWAVTGTPIGRSLHDLLGLCIFLRIKPFLKEKQCWNDLLTGNQSLLHQLFAHLMRRKTKLEVGSQLGLPELKIETNWLSLSPIEGFFYNSTYKACEKTFKQKIDNILDLDQPLKKANRKTVDAVLSPLLSLRQACVYPMTGGNSNQFNFRKGETMQELLVKMIQKTKIGCEDLLRLYVMFVNGWARLNILGGKYADAVALYRSVLMKMKIYSDLKPDNFQMMHIMHNMYETSVNDTTIELTEEELKFPQEIDELERKCFEKLQEELTTMKELLSKYNAEMSSYMDSYKLQHFMWWDKMLGKFKFEDIILKVKEALGRDNIEITRKLNLKFISVNRLCESLKFWLSDIESKRSLLFEFLEQITNSKSREALWTAADVCHIRKNVPKKTCIICKMENTMLQYEDLLFNVSKTENKETNWKPYPLEYVLNGKGILVTQSRSMLGTTTENLNASHQIKVLGLLRKEFRAIRAIWTKQCDLLHVFDEIRMAKSTVDPNDTNEDILQYENTVLQDQITTYRVSSTDAYFKLQSKYGSLQYLKNLEKRYKCEGTSVEACPVCHMSIDEKRAVTICGHFTCYGCMQILFKNCHRQSIVCPICRSSVPLSSITYIHGGGISDYDLSGVEGNYSIKILAITAKVLELTKNDPNIKILVFSTWEHSLNVIEDSFKKNEISFHRYVPGNHRRSSLTSFKSNRNMNVLLMLLRSGSKGLNITEASHIIFAEPVLHLADEKQAVGRIDRLGQTKNMVVHKFIVKCTVEEHLHRMNEELLNSSYKNDLTFRHLRDLFVASSNNLDQS